MTVRHTPADLAHLLGTDPPTAEQAAVIGGPLRPGGVVAGAGSGKTSTMAARVVWLVANGLVAPEGVLGLTFTRKAAAELSSRVRRRLEQLRSRGLVDADAIGGEPTVSTYHSYAGRLVADHALREGREPSARLISPAVQWQLATRVVGAYDGPMTDVENGPAWVIDAVLALAGELSEHLRSPAELRAELLRWRTQAESTAGRPAGGAKKLLTTTGTTLQLLPLVEAYIAAKRTREVLDYGDTVALAARIALRHPEVGSIERSRFPVVLLDEYQDTGHVQRELLRAMYGEGHPVTAVGDPCQSIYGWRGASAGGLRRFAEHFPYQGAPSAVQHLATSFRNGERILAVANRLAEPLHATDAAVPVLRPSPAGAGRGSVACALLETSEAEAAWVADRVAAVLAASGGRSPDGASAVLRASDVAVLCRKRSQFALLRAALAARNLPVEVVGLGGLLTVPEVLDIVSTLRVLVDPSANASAVRLLTGPRLRLGARDLVALGRRARWLAAYADQVLAAPGGGSSVPPRGSSPHGSPPNPGTAGRPEDGDIGSLPEALEDPGPAAAYSPLGFSRLTAFGVELRDLRRRTDSPLPDLVAEVERALGLDIEVAAKAGVEPHPARADLDAFIDAAAEFAGEEEEPTLRAFLAYLTAAVEEEFGLETGRVGASDSVKLLTVHAAKGLEWPVVAIPGLAAGAKSAVFPARPATSTKWTHNPQLLPFGLRGDVADLPPLHDLSAEAVTAFEEACGARQQLEERRLAYVAVTRAASLLLCSGYWWGEGKTRLGPSIFLTEVRAVLTGTGSGEIDEWCAEPVVIENPWLDSSATTVWPPLAGGTAGVREGARLVAAAAAGRPPDPEGLPSTEAARADEWVAAVRLLLAERGAADPSNSDIEVPLPERLSVTTLVALQRDPAVLARAIRRPLPRQPAPSARRGTAFHTWLESHYGQLKLLDLDELPGFGDEGAPPDADLVALQAAFRDSEWWVRTPVEVEVPFEADVAGTLVRGRIDAVFRDADGGWTVIDWKTGHRPAGADAGAAAVQLAAYRLAWAALQGVPPESVRAGFHYVRDGVTVRPADLLDAAALSALVRRLPLASA